LLTLQGKFAEAVAYFDELIESNPEMGKAYAERGRAKNELGDKEGAFADLKKAIELNPTGEEAQRFNGQHSNFNNLNKGGIY
ncbi:MAG: tetratricopeptide repeat protein, partial [Parabacteroides sp.]